MSSNNNNNNNPLSNNNSNQQSHQQSHQPQVHQVQVEPQPLPSSKNALKKKAKEQKVKALKEVKKVVNYNNNNTITSTSSSSTGGGNGGGNGSGGGNGNGGGGGGGETPSSTSQKPKPSPNNNNNNNNNNVTTILEEENKILNLLKGIEKGGKKDPSIPLAPGYNPTIVEKCWYDWWQSSSFFHPLPSTTPSKGQLTIPTPPPNVTGNLHIGHALTFSIQDTLIRWARMSNWRVLLIPGYDHAGISTQAVVEKRLYKIEGKTRHEFGREEFLKRVWKWNDEYAARISGQMRRLGASFEWDRLAFTLSPELSEAVIETFCQLHEKGILYRANRLVNWCCFLNTSISNLEVDQKELEGRTFLTVAGYDPKEKFEFGALTSFAYEIEGSDERIVVATTRPETMLGDTGIAVHPDDKRYQHLINKYALHPFVPNRKIPIVADKLAVDMSFGTGAVKMTPAHDPNDFEVGVRHKLEFVNILNDDGTLNENAGQEFKGVKRFHARNKVIEALKEKGLYVETTSNPMKVPICSRSGDVVEPMLKPQWWVDCKSMAQDALKRTAAGELTIHPKTSEKDWSHWLENIQDWCISRQLWWGHRCPAYFVRIEGKAADTSDGTRWIVARTKEEAEKKAAEKFSGEKYTLEQDEDVLDTWFSSGLWPFSILGWPRKTPDFEQFYPTTLLVTGWDILFFWVARMVMLGITLTGKMPFKEVICHAMVRDAHGRKMSKSLGNVIDPLDVIEGASLESLQEKLMSGNLDEKEVNKAKQGQKKDYPNGIPQCGLDALRFTLCAYTHTGRDINLDVGRVEGYRKFCNKLYNATKFAMLKFEGGFVPEPTDKPTGQESLVEKWILTRLNTASANVSRNLLNRNFMAATTDLYDFWLYELCDVYIEAIKPTTDSNSPTYSASAHRSAQNTLYTALDAGLRMMHPFMPFVTEELWQRLPRRPNDETPSIMVAKYPEPTEDFENPQAQTDFESVFASIKAVRSLASTYGLNSNLQVFIHTNTPKVGNLLSSQTSMMTPLIKGCKSVTVVPAEQVPVGCASEAVGKEIVVHLLVRGLVNFEAEITKATKKLSVAKMGEERVLKQMAMEGYETKIREEVRKGNDERLQTLRTEMETLNKSIQNFEQLKG